MPQQDDLVAAGRRLLTNNYRQAPIVMARGEGCALYDVEGRRYLDMTAGVAVCVLGHGHPGLADAIAAQARRLVHVSNLYYIEAQLQLAEALSRRAFAGRVFFCNSGTEANEAALKLARRYQIVTRGQPERTEIVAFDNSFHGRTLGALSVTGQPKYREGFGPLVTPGPLRAVRRCRRRRARRSPIARPPSSSSRSRPRAASTCRPPGYLQELRRACTDAGAVLIFDEIQTGTGRTGTFYAFEGEGVVPDVVTLAKGLAGGVPIGAMLANEEVARGFEPGTHASTFGGNPFATAAALFVQNAIDELGLLEHCREMGGHLGSALLRLAERRRPRTRGARGRGLLQGLIIDGDPADVVTRARAAGLLLSVAGANIVRFVPPLIVGKAEIDEAIEILDHVLGEAR